MSELSDAEWLRDLINDGIELVQRDEQKALAIADRLETLERENARLIKGIEDALRGTTHWDGCEERHWECALLKSVGK